MKNYDVLNLLFSADCQLRCSYCYVVKQESSMKCYNSRLQDALKTGKFAEQIKEEFSDCLQSFTGLSLWGGEPFINGKYLAPFVIDLFNHFKKMRSVDFSSNFALNANIYKQFFQELDSWAKENNEKIQVRFQISIDGPKDVTDSLRGAGVTDKILNNIKDVVSWCHDNVSENTTIYFATKSTLSSDTFAKINDRASVLAYLKFFDDMFDSVQPYMKKTLHFNCLSGPTLTTPAYATKEDGEAFAEWIRNVSCIEESNFKWYKHPYYMQLFTPVLSYLFTTNRLNERLSRCGAGQGVIGYTLDGNFFTCHNYYDREINNKDKMTTESKLFSTLSDNNKHQSLMRGEYLWELDTQYVGFYYANFVAQMEALKLAGLIQPQYYDDPDLLNFAFLACKGISCMCGNAIDTKSQWSLDIGLMKLYCNGAIEAYIDYMRSAGWIKFV